MAQTLEVSLIEKSISQRFNDADKGVIGQWEHNPVCGIVSITAGPGDIVGFADRDPVTNQRRHKFKHDDMLRIIIEFQGAGQSKMDFNIQDVTNQAGWTHDPAGLAQALVDINAWAAECNESSGGGGLPAGAATEAKQDAMILELMKGSDFELSCVEDINTGIHYIMRVYRLDTDGSIVVDYIDATGSVVVPPVPGDLRVCNPSAALAAILAEIVKQSPGATSVVTNQNTSATSVTLKAANADRKELIITNNSDQILYVKHGVTAVIATSFTWKVGIDEAIVIQNYTGVVDGIFTAAGIGNVMITETTT